MGLSASGITERAGQFFVVGFSGERPSPEFLRFISEENIGGVILFSENCPTHQATKRNIDLIRETLKTTVPFVAVDQEGGRVCRISRAPAEFRAASEYGRRLGLKRFKEDYSRSALYLESLGINLNLAPVCDIFLNASNRCLKDRCFGDTAESIVPFVETAVEATQKAGLLCCLKHFPGLGAAGIDPHEQASIVDYDEIVWEQREKLPFTVGVERGADMIMTTHVRLPQLDDQIVTGSRKVVSALLRRALFFDGPVITDDLTMKGADCLGHFGERAVAAFNAGHDLLLFGQDADAAVQACDYFKSALQRGEIPADRITASLNRIAGTKFKLGKSVSL